MKKRTKKTSTDTGPGYEIKPTAAAVEGYYLGLTIFPYNAPAVIRSLGSIIPTYGAAHWFHGVNGNFHVRPEPYLDTLLAQVPKGTLTRISSIGSKARVDADM